MPVAFRIAGAALAACMLAAPMDLVAQSRGGGGQARPGSGQGRGGVAVPGGRQGGGRGVAPRDGLTPREIQAQFDAYFIGQAESVLQITDDQYGPFVRRVRTLQGVRREARVQRNRMLAQLAQMLRQRDSADEARLAAAIKAVDDHERNTTLEVQKAFTAIDEVLTPWQRARFRVLEDQLEQKKLEMVIRARQGPRRQ